MNFYSSGLRFIIDSRCRHHDRDKDTDITILLKTVAGCLIDECLTLQFCADYQVFENLPLSMFLIVSKEL